MESFTSCGPSTSKVPHNFQFIPFVSSSGQTNIQHAENRNENVSDSNLSGEEASLFYRGIISSPPTCLASVECTQKRHTVTKKATPFFNTRRTIFHCAQDGDIEGIKHYLSRKSDVDIQDMYGWTPLMCATFEGHYAVAEHLVKNGAKLDIKNKQGLTALDIAHSKNHRNLTELFNNGTVNETKMSEIEMEKEIKYCDLCKCSYSESLSKHEKSIIHLFSSKNKNISTYYCIPENNKGFQIMLKKGWDKNNGLGANANGRKFPIKTVLKTDRTCIGGTKEIPKVTHFGPNDYRSVKKDNQPILNLRREKKIKKAKMKKLEKKNCQLEIEFRRQFHLE